MRSDAFSKCHPAVNLLFFLGAICASVLIQHPAYVLVSIAAAALYYLLLSGSKGLKRILILLPVFVFVTAINPLFNHYGDRVLFTVFGRPYTLEALLYGAALAGVLVSMLLWFGCYNAVLTEDKFTCLFGNLAPALSLLLVMVLRMIPNLIRKGKQISGARMSVGKDASNGKGLVEKLSGGMLVIGTLMSWALEGGVVTSDSMMARGYGTAKRSSFMIYRLTRSDGVLAALLAALLAAIIAFCVKGAAFAEFTPKLDIAPITGANAIGFIVFVIYMLIPSVMHIREAVQWNISRSRI